MDTTTNTFFESALGYARRGWKVIPVHAVIPAVAADGTATLRCTCGKDCGSNAGKHPAGAGWQRGGLVGAADLAATWLDAPTPRNIGILTGTPSGVWALDIDPKSGGPASLERLEAEHGPLPATYGTVTGSGGLHLLWRMPDGLDIRNGQSRLAPGLDVRGTGGMVVAAPSVSAVGAYVAASDADTIDAPPWLVDLVVVRAVEGPPTTVAVEDLPGMADLTVERRHELARYTTAAVRAEVARYRNAPPGCGSLTLYEVACNLLELAQAPWNALTTAGVWSALDGAREDRVAGGATASGGQTRGEFEATMRSAQGRVVGHARAVPLSRTEGVMFDPPGGAPAPDGPGADDVGGGVGGGDPGGLSLTQSDSANDHGLASGDTEIDPVDAMLASMLDRDGLDQLTPPRPLIKGVLEMDSESWIIGAPGGFKSFVALDWAAHVGAGAPWRGREVTRGPVVYIVAEGGKGLRRRVKAWERTYGRRMEGVRFLPRPVQVADLDGGRPALSGAWWTLVQACRRLEPAMIVIDTQARVTVGLEENSATAMGVLIEAVRLLREATGACVLTVHHVGRDGANARGSSALDGAQDTEIRVDRPRQEAGRRALTATISIDKQKDGDESATWPIEMVICDDVDVDADGGPVSSLAIKPWNPFDVPRRVVPDWEENLTANQGSVIAALRDHADEAGATKTTVVGWLKERGVAMPRTSYDSAVRDLVKKGFVERVSADRIALVEHLS